MLDNQLCSEYASSKSVLTGNQYTVIICMKNLQKIKALLNGTDMVNVENSTRNKECLCCHEVKAVEYFELLGVKYDDE